MNIMKPIRKILGGLFLLGGFIAALNLLHAQDAATSGQDQSITDTNIDWNSMSDLEVELKAIESMPTISASQFEASGLTGTFYSAQHAPGTENEWPPLPGDWLSLPVWEIDTNLFLIDDLDYDYAAAQAARYQRGRLRRPDGRRLEQFAEIPAWLKPHEF
jgi:hypothetical protein